MRERDLLAHLLGIAPDWSVTNLVLDDEAQRMTVFVAYGGKLECPECGRPVTGYDTKRRRWRHLHTCLFQTYIVAAVPRAKCSEHGVRQIRVPWAQPRSRFTTLFERLIADWLRETSVSAVSRRLDLTWDEVDGVMI